MANARPRFRSPIRRAGPEERLSVVTHLTELRNRLFVCIGALFAAFIVAYVFRTQLIDLLRRPLPDGQDKLYTFAPHEAFINTMKVCFATAILATLPLLFYQLYAYIIPAFRTVRRRAMLATVAAVSLLFLGGVAFGYLIVVPAALKFLLGFDGGTFIQNNRASDYFSFVTAMLFFTGLVFEVPAAMVALARLGIVTAERFAKWRRGAIVAISVIAALLPGGDPVSMILLMIPMYLLYEVGIRLAKIFGGEPILARYGLGDESPTEN